LNGLPDYKRRYLLWSDFSEPDIFTQLARVDKWTHRDGVAQ